MVLSIASVVHSCLCTVYMFALTCSTRPVQGSDDGGGGSTAVPGRVSGTESRHSEPAALLGAGVLQTLTHPETRTGASHGKDHLYTTCKQMQKSFNTEKDEIYRNRTSLHLLPKSCCRSTSLSVRECARMGGPRAAPGYGRRARGDPDASGSIRGCTPPAAATQIRNKTKVGNLIRVAQFPNCLVGINAWCVQEQCCHYSWLSQLILLP